jgi:hypothetical protein
MESQEKTTELNHHSNNRRSQEKTFVTTDPVTDLAELAHIILNLRHRTKLFDEYYGTDNRISKKHWEVKADEWIEKHSKKD